MATENKAYIEAMRGIRQSSAAQPHRNKAKYTRKTKHKGARYDD